MNSDGRLEQPQRDLARLRAPAKPPKGRDAGRGPEAGHGRKADHPARYRRAAGRTSSGAPGAKSRDQDLFLIAGGGTYAVLLALFPDLAALVSLYGFVFEPATLSGR